MSSAPLPRLALLLSTVTLVAAGCVIGTAGPPPDPRPGPPLVEAIDEPPPPARAEPAVPASSRYSSSNCHEARGLVSGLAVDHRPHGTAFEVQNCTLVLRGVHLIGGVGVEALNGARVVIEDSTIEAATALRLRADAEVTVRDSEVRGLIVTEATAWFVDAGGNRWFDAEGRRLDAAPGCDAGVVCDHLGPVR
jgi:hypothetical protein